MAHVKGTKKGEDLIATTKDDTIFGLGGDDEMFAREGNDIMDGGDGDDTYDGYKGNDFMWHSKGKDHFGGGDGKDTVSYEKAKEGLVISDITSYNDGAAFGDTFGGVEIFKLTRFNDRLSFSYYSVAYAGKGDDYVTAGYAAAKLYGEAGNDTLGGGDKNDRLDGGDGNDTLSGRDGNDILLAGSGDDILSGSTGNDKMDGGSGKDRFGADVGNDTQKGGTGADEFGLTDFHEGHDTVTDFTVADGDILNFYMLSDSANRSYEAVMAAADNVGKNTLIEFSDDISVTLKGIHKEDITEEMVIFSTIF